MLSIKDVLSHIIIKQKAFADNYDKALQDAGYDVIPQFLSYRSAVTSEDTLYTYKYTVEDLSEFTNDINKINMMIRKEGGPSAIYRFLNDDQVKKLLLKKRRQQVITYKEYNPYYREILGLPPMKWEKVFEPLTRTEKLIVKDDPSQYYYITTPMPGVDISKPVHEWTYAQKALLSTYKFPAKDLLKYPYLNNIAKGVDIISLREAGPFELIWTNIKSTGGLSKLLPFLDMYRLNLKNFLATHYSEYDAITYPNYEKLQCIILFLATLAHVNAQDPLINMGGDNLSINDIYALFDSYGVPRFRFGKKYLNVLASNINELIYNKATNADLSMISDLFHDIKVFKYFLVKTVKDGVSDEDLYETEKNKDGSVKKDEHGNVVFKKDSDGNMIKVPEFEDKLYNLKYVKTHILADDPIPYMDDHANIESFRSIVDADDKWGSNSIITDLNYNKPNPEHVMKADPKLEHHLKRQNFSWTESKYLGVDNIIHLGWMSTKIAMLYRWFVDNPKITNSDVYKIYYEYADIDTTVYELMLYLQCLVFYKYKRQPSIPDNLAAYFKIVTLSNKVNVKDIKGVLARVYKETLFAHKEKIDKGEVPLHEKIEDPTVNETDKGLNNRLNILLSKMTLQDLNYVMNEYFDRRPIDPVVKDILDRFLWLYWKYGFTKDEELKMSPRELEDAPTEKNLILRKAKYSKTNNIFDDGLVDSDDKDEYEKAREDYFNMMAKDYPSRKLTDNSSILSTIDFITHLEKPTDYEGIVNRESVTTTKDRFHNMYSRFEVDVDIVMMLYRLRENATDYRDYEMIDTMLKVLTEGDKLSAQFSIGGERQNDLLAYLVNLNPNNIAFSKRINELAEYEESRMSNFDSEIIEVVSTLRSFLNEHDHTHAADALEYMQRLYSDNEVLRYLQEIIDYFKSYTQDFINGGVTYIMDDGNNIVHLLEEMEKEVSLKDWDLGSMFLLMSSFPTETLVRIRDILSPHYYTYTSERLEIKLPYLGKYVELATDGLLLT